jgi:hypothetical protein
LCGLPRRGTVASDRHNSGSANSRKSAPSARASNCTVPQAGSRSPYGRGLLLTKPDGTNYCVNLAGPDRSCDCKGFEQHGHCKHTESLLALAAAGKL